jgi:hypothetical protein
MQSGDRLSYHPEHAQEEIAHFHEALPKAQASVAAIDASFSQRLEDWVKRLKRFSPQRWLPGGIGHGGPEANPAGRICQSPRQVDEAGK